MKYTLGLKGVPFEPHPKQIIYVENEYDEEINHFIFDHHENICNYFKLFGYEFCYLPLMAENFSKDTHWYYNPDVGDVLRCQSVGSSFLLNYMPRPQNRHNIPPSLIYYKENIEVKPDEDIALRGITIGDIRFRDSEFADILSDIIEDCSQNWDSEIRFCYEAKPSNESYSISRSEPKEETYICCSIDPIPHLEEQFDEETQNLVKEVADKIKKLKQKGISAYVLESLLRNPNDKLSRMVITADYRIILPDYNDMEIVMTPLVKAVYILFLRHEDGIPFKHLSDYHDELLQIYTNVRGGWLTSEMKKSVIYATSPFNNSINEKCARIREAFVSQFDEHLAKHYFVTGKRGEPKKIALSRDLVKWE